MKHLTLVLFFAVIALGDMHQTYICLAPSITNSPGNIAEKSNLSIEVGRQWDVFL